MKKIDQDKKSTISKLLATENVHVVHRKTQTASFNVATRELTLPIFKKEISNDVYDMFVCHEVGHALWTPLDMLDKVKELGIDKSVVNVIEDARIEKMIQKKYPGSVSNFKNGYKELLKSNFFGIKDKDLSQMNIIDKINIYFKTGLDVGFTPEELLLAKLVDKCKTPEDVLELAGKISGYHKKKKKKEDEKKQSMPIDSKDGKDNIESSDSQDDSDKISDKDNRENEENDNDGDEDSKDNQKRDSKVAESMAEGGGKTETDLESATDRQLESETDKFINSLEEGIAKQIDSNALDNNYVNVPSKINLNKLIVSAKDILKDLNGDLYWNAKSNTDSEEIWKTNLDKEIVTLFNENKKIVSYMVKEFEMKKSADQYKRATVSKTGMLDMNKVHTYKFNDDLFAKMTTIPGATNHGMIMYLDWSGSMAWNMKETLKQLYNLIWFCQRTKIPYQVLAFSDHHDTDGDRSWFDRKENTDLKRLVQIPVHNEINIDPLRLLEFFNSDMNKGDTMKMMKYLLGFADYWDRYGDLKEGSCIYIPSKYNLGGTPLDAAILTIPTIENAFVQKHKIQKSNIVILTDGDSHNCGHKFTLSDKGWNVRGENDYYSNTTLTDKKTNKSVKWGYDHRVDTTTKLLELIKLIKPSMSLTGFFLAGTGKAGRVSLRTIEHKFGISSYRDKEKVIKVQKELRKNKVAVCKSQGYDEYYILPTLRNIESEDLIIKPNAKTSGIKSAFIKSMNAKTVNRQLLNKFIGVIA